MNSLTPGADVLPVHDPTFIEHMPTSKDSLYHLEALGRIEDASKIPHGMTELLEAERAGAGVVDLVQQAMRYDLTHRVIKGQDTRQHYAETMADMGLEDDFIDPDTVGKAVDFLLDNPSVRDFLVGAVTNFCNWDGDERLRKKTVGALQHYTRGGDYEVITAFASDHGHLSSDTERLVTDPLDGHSHVPRFVTLKRTENFADIVNAHSGINDEPDHVVLRKRTTILIDTESKHAGADSEYFRAIVDSFNHIARHNDEILRYRSSMSVIALQHQDETDQDAKARLERLIAHLDAKCDSLTAQNDAYFEIISSILDRLLVRTPLQRPVWVQPITTAIYGVRPQLLDQSAE